MVMRKLDKPPKMTLPNGRTFYTMYNRVQISKLANNVTCE